jgi:dihydroorotase-like cyclic amidohydrolase
VGVGLPRLAQLLSSNPATLIGFANRKGIIKTGYDADLVVRGGTLGPDEGF